MLRVLILLLTILSLTACQYVPKLDDVLPDNRVDYKKSQSLPDLEVPPDLTAGAINDSMAVPGEQQATLSQYQRQRSAGPTAAADPAAAASDEQWVAVRGTRYDVWPRLREFFQGRGHKLELDDAELGVLETDWSAPLKQGNLVSRFKYKVFSEAGGDAGTTVLFVSSQRQQQVRAQDGSEQWIDQGKAEDAEKQMAGTLNLFLNGAAGATAQQPAAGSTRAAAVPAPAPAPARPQAELVSAGDGKTYLAMPEEYSGAFKQTEVALQKSGFIIDQKDPEKGTFALTYYDNPDQGEEEKGWFSKLAFWKDDGSEGRPYQVSLTGVGDKTELIVLNEQGDWEINQDATRILTTIQKQYNLR